LDRKRGLDKFIGELVVLSNILRLCIIKDNISNFVLILKFIIYFKYNVFISTSDIYHIYFNYN